MEEPEITDVPVESEWPERVPPAPPLTLEWRCRRVGEGSGDPAGEPLLETRAAMEVEPPRE
jgi:hypothetical protein